MAAAAAPLTWPLDTADGDGRVYTSFQLDDTPARPDAATYRPLTQTDISNWTF